MLLPPIFQLTSINSLDIIKLHYYYRLLLLGLVSGHPDVASSESRPSLHDQHPSFDGRIWILSVPLSDHTRLEHVHHNQSWKIHAKPRRKSNSFQKRWSFQKKQCFGWVCTDGLSYRGIQGHGTIMRYIVLDLWQFHDVVGLTAGKHGKTIEAMNWLQKDQQASQKMEGHKKKPTALKMIQPIAQNLSRKAKGRKLIQQEVKDFWNIRNCWFPACPRTEAAQTGLSPTTLIIFHSRPSEIQTF